MKQFPWLVLSVLCFFTISCNNTDKPDDNKDTKPVPSLSYTIGASVPHDTSHFTQGLEFYNNILIEGTGINGKSKIAQIDPATGKILKEVKLDPKYFGEGITILRDTLYQLTYQEHVVHVYNAKDFNKIKEFPLAGEGWGLTNDGKNLILSNGTSSLYFYDPSNFKLIREQFINENGSPVINLNELEYINGFVYANQWQSPYIFKINPSTGEAVAKLDLTSLVAKLKMKDPNAEVLNGIAFNPTNNKIYITGKNWPEIYEIQFEH